MSRAGSSAAVPASVLRASQGQGQGGFVRRRTMPSDDTEHQHTPDEERTIREAALDQTIEGSFPASDPPSSNPNPDDHTALQRQPPKDR